MTEVLFSLGRKEPSLVLVLICCVTSSKSLSLSGPLVEKWGLQGSFQPCSQFKAIQLQMAWVLLDSMT